MTSTVFLDTSIQVRRILSEAQESAVLEAVLTSSECQAITSNYVWMEYQRTAVADYAHIYSVMRQYEDWGDLFSHALDGSRAFRPRSAVRCTKIIGNLYRESQQLYELAQNIIELRVESGLRREFWRNVSPVSDPITCDLVSIGVNYQFDGNFSVADSCRKDMASCHLPEFLDQNRAKLQSIVDYLATHKQAVKDQARVTKLLSAVIENPRNALGQAACWPLGDLIIALQVPEDAFLWTLDADFKLFATVLGLKIYQPSLKGD